MVRSRKNRWRLGCCREFYSTKQKKFSPAMMMIIRLQGREICRPCMQTNIDSEMIRLYMPHYCTLVVVLVPLTCFKLSSYMEDQNKTHQYRYPVLEWHEFEVRLLRFREKKVCWNEEKEKKTSIKNTTVSQNSIDFRPTRTS